MNWLKNTLSNWKVIVALVGVAIVVATVLSAYAQQPLVSSDKNALITDVETVTVSEKHVATVNTVASEKNDAADADNTDNSENTTKSELTE